MTPQTLVPYMAPFSWRNRHKLTAKWRRSRPCLSWLSTVNCFRKLNYKNKKQLWIKKTTNPFDTARDTFSHHHYHHRCPNREGRWGTTDDFTTSVFHFSLFSTALWDLAISRPVCSLVLSSHLFLCLPCLLPPFTVPCKMVLAKPINGRHDHTTAVCVSLRWSVGLRVVRLRSGSWHGLFSW